jgi:deoxyribodipyrimidine photo-lyase
MKSTYRVRKSVTKPKYPLHLKKLPVSGISPRIQFTPNDNVYVRGGYKNAESHLKHFVKNELHEYEKKRNFFNFNTSFLSAYLSLNVISIRQVYHATKSSEAFIRELFWREFYIHVIHFFPARISKYSMKPRLNATQSRKWIAWKTGKTGVELVDACMNQLITTGYMHNRGRMIVASYLIKNMHVPFQYGEEFFSKTLIDYNTASNNGGWQWVNGSGVDAQPRYQKFNPDLQLKKFDPDRSYTDKWIKSPKKLMRK